MSDLTDRPLCSTCGFPLDEYNAGLRYFGTHTTHVEWYCAQRMRGEIGAQAAEVERLTMALNKIAERTSSEDPCRNLVQIARDALRAATPR